MAEKKIVHSAALSKMYIKCVRKFAQRLCYSCSYGQTHIPIVYTTPVKRIQYIAYAVNKSDVYECMTRIARVAYGFLFNIIFISFSTHTTYTKSIVTNIEYDEREKENDDGEEEEESKL